MQAEGLREFRNFVRLSLMGHISYVPKSDVPIVKGFVFLEFH